MNMNFEQPSDEVSTLLRSRLACTYFVCGRPLFAMVAEHWMRIFGNFHVRRCMNQRSYLRVNKRSTGDLTCFVYVRDPKYFGGQDKAPACETL